MIFVILAFVMGVLLYKFVPKYLNNISILNTFFMVVLLYFFQLSMEILRCLILCIDKFKNKKILIKNLIVHKVVIINFCTFILCLLAIFLFSLLILFFSNLRIVFIIFFGFTLAIIYSFYTMVFLKLEGYKFYITRNNQYDFFILVLMNTLLIILSTNIFYLIQRYYIFIAVCGVVLNSILYSFNKTYIVKKF